MKFSIIAKHKELRELSFELAEFRRLQIAGEIRNSNDYSPRFKFSVFGLSFDVPTFGLVYFVNVRVYK